MKTLQNTLKHKLNATKPEVSIYCSFLDLDQVHGKPIFRYCGTNDFIFVE